MYKIFCYKKLITITLKQINFQINVNQFVSLKEHQHCTWINIYKKKWSK